MKHYAKIENDNFQGFYLEKEGNCIEISKKEYEELLECNLNGEIIFYNKENNKLEKIKLDSFETLENNKVKFKRDEKIESLKKELSALKVEYSEKEFLFQGKYWQKNREKGDRDNLTGIVVLLMATNQNTYDGWKVIDKETGEHVYLKLTLDDFKLMALHMQEQVTKSMKTETALKEKLETLLDEELKLFNAREEFEKLWN